MGSVVYLAPRVTRNPSSGRGTASRPCDLSNQSARGRRSDRLSSVAHRGGPAPGHGKAHDARGGRMRCRQPARRINCMVPGCRAPGVAVPPCGLGRRSSAPSQPIAIGHFPPTKCTPSPMVVGFGLAHPRAMRQQRTARRSGGHREVKFRAPRYAFAAAIAGAGIVLIGLSPGAGWALIAWAYGLPSTRRNSLLGGASRETPRSRNGRERSWRAGRWHVRACDHRCALRVARPARHGVTGAGFEECSRSQAAATGPPGSASRGPIRGRAVALGRKSRAPGRTWTDRELAPPLECDEP
jgi:hypothetical protein